jgi:hypothetical protein
MEPKIDPDLLTTENQVKQLDQIQLLSNNYSIIDTANSTSHFYTIGYGMGILQIKELNLMPKVNKGFQNSFIIKHEIRNEKYKALSLFGSYGSPETDIEKENDDTEENVNVQLEIKYLYEWRILEKSSYSYYLGPYIAYSYSISSYPIWDESHAYWGTSILLGVSNNQFVELKKNKIWNTSFDFSLLGFVSRPDTYRFYKIEDWSFMNILNKTNSNYNFSTWNNSYRIYFSSGIILPLTSKTSFGISYSLFYSRIDSNNSNPLQELLHLINLKIIL